MFTKAQLVEFGNFLFKAYDVRVYSSDGKNQPIYLRQVTDADLCNWKDGEPPKKGNNYTHGDEVRVFVLPEHLGSFDGFTAHIVAIHDYVNKTKYDLELKLGWTSPTRIYNIDETFISRPHSGQ